VRAALLAGCRSFFGYPITPASEIAEAAARLFPAAGGTFLQAESELAAIQMVYGAASAGERTMTASSGPGISLMQEGISYLAGAELPAVIVDITRAGPGLGNIGPEQGDYHQVVKGGGHGTYRTLVLAPASVQEMADLTILAFDLAERYRNPAVVMADGIVGQMIEPASFPEPPPPRSEPGWAVAGTPATRRNLITSIHLDHDIQETHERRLEEKYRRAEREEPRAAPYRAEDAEVLLVGYGVVGRILKSAADRLRERGVAAGLFRPVSLWPFPALALREAAVRAERVLVVEMSQGQMLEDVERILGGRGIEFLGRMGGNTPSTADVVETILKGRVDAARPA
jgi:pyruvate/2-oxoacid:ferredoxin oxidoreductase alpha subunit